MKGNEITLNGLIEEVLAQMRERNYGKKSADGLCMQRMRPREPQMDGTVYLRRVEHDDRRKSTSPRGNR